MQNTEQIVHAGTQTITTEVVKGDFEADHEAIWGFRPMLALLGLQASPEMAKHLATIKPIEGNDVKPAKYSISAWLGRVFNPKEIRKARKAIGTGFDSRPEGHMVFENAELVQKFKNFFQIA